MLKRQCLLAYGRSTWKHINIWQQPRSQGSLLHPGNEVDQTNDFLICLGPETGNLLGPLRLVKLLMKTEKYLLI